MTRLVNETRLLLVPGVNSDIYGMFFLLYLYNSVYGRLCGGLSPESASILIMKYINALSASTESLDCHSLQVIASYSFAYQNLRYLHQISYILTNGTLIPLLFTSSHIHVPLLGVISNIATASRCFVCADLRPAFPTGPSVCLGGGRRRGNRLHFK